MRTCSISLTDAITEVKGSYQGPGEHLNHPLPVLHLESVQGVYLALHFTNLSALEVFVRRVQRAEREIRAKAGKGGKP